jgi:predicted phage tail protein
MLTKVRLDGVMGKKFGKEWELDVSSPAEALRMIEANKPGLKAWIIANREKYDAYRVVCTFDDDREEELGDSTYAVTRTNLKSIRFSPTVAGASGVAKIIVGIIIIVANFLTIQNPYLYKLGATLIIGGVIEVLSPRPRQTEPDQQRNSFYFDGPVNTERQGNPVPLIYGQVLIGSHPISASISVDEVAPT